MVEHSDRKGNSRQNRVYQIRVEGHLRPRCAGWFGEMTICLEENGVTRLTGPVVDQAALQGLLRKIWGLGLPLLSVNRVDQQNSGE